MRTQEQQQQMIDESHRDAIEQLRTENEHSDEYFNRKFHWRVDFTGTMNVPANISFRPNHSHLTEFELDSIIVKYLRGKEDEFKIVGIHKMEFPELTEEQKSTGKKLNDIGFNPFALLQDNWKNRSIYNKWKHKPKKNKFKNKFKK